MHRILLLLVWSYLLILTAAFPLPKWNFDNFFSSREEKSNTVGGLWEKPAHLFDVLFRRQYTSDDPYEIYTEDSAYTDLPTPDIYYTPSTYGGGYAYPTPISYNYYPVTPPYISNYYSYTPTDTYSVATPTAIATTSSDATSTTGPTAAASASPSRAGGAGSHILDRPWDGTNAISATLTVVAAALGVGWWIGL